MERMGRWGGIQNISTILLVNRPLRYLLSLYPSSPPLLIYTSYIAFFQYEDLYAIMEIEWISCIFMECCCPSLCRALPAAYPAKMPVTDFAVT